VYAEFERLRDRAIGEGQIAGAVALTVDRGGVTYESAAGRRAIAPDAAAMTPDTVFWIASMTKAIASVAALKEVERGRLTLDDDLSALIPEFGALEVFDKPGPDGVWSTRPAKRGPTLRELLTHTNGFSYFFIDGRIPAWQAAKGAASNSGTRAELHQPLLFDPGEGWGYGIGIDWAGIAVEAASGQRLDAYLAENVFGPLGMADTGFLGGLSAEQRGRAAAMHARTPQGGLAPMAFGMAQDPEVLSGGGGLYSTAADYGRFLRLLLNGGELDGARVLSADGMKALGAVQTGARRAGTWTSAAPPLSNDIDLFPGMQTGWGLATMITPQRGPNGRSPGSLAWAGLGNTYYWADPAAGKGGVLLTQLLPFGDPVVLELLGALERGAYA